LVFQKFAVISGFILAGASILVEDEQKIRIGLGLPQIVTGPTLEDKWQREQVGENTFGTYFISTRETRSRNSVVNPVPGIKPPTFNQ